MATEIIQLPTGQNGNGTGMGYVPVASNGGLFGNNGQTSLMDLFGFAIVASIFPNIFGYGYGNIDSALALQAVTSVAVFIKIK